MEQRVSIERMEEAINLFGSFDENIRLLEAEFHVTVVNRDGELRISGEPEEVMMAAKAVEALLTLSGKGESITEQHVRYVIGLCRSGQSERIGELTQDVICITSKGRPVKPKTIGQKEYIKSVLQNTITIGVGSAGTITGVGETIKAWTNDVRIVAVEPFECQALTGGVTGPHIIPDIGFGLVPKNFNSYVVDNVAAVSSKDAQRAAQQVLRTDAIPASASAGAALHAAAKLVANGISRSALAVFSGRQNLL